MRKPVEPGSEARAIVDDEQRLLDRVRAFCDRREHPDGRAPADYDATLIELRDQIAEEKPEDLPSLVEQMTRVQALASGRNRRLVAPIDAASP